MPFYLVRPIHTFGWGESPDSAWAIPLRKDKQFLYRVYISDWCIPMAMLCGLASVLLLCAGTIIAVIFSVVCFILFILSIVGLVYLKATNKGRDRDLRLVLGRHIWGTSDPATWHKRLLKMVLHPRQSFGVDSFAQLAQIKFQEGKWAEAMWAARLCVALEHRQFGEDMTDEILYHPKVQRRLQRVRKNPKGEWEKAFGQKVLLNNYVLGDVHGEIFEVKGN